VITCFKTRFIQAGTAPDEIYLYRFSQRGDGLTGTGTDAFEASFAFEINVPDLFIRGLGFRIAAPCAPERTTFEENQCPDAGPVMNSKMLNIKKFTLLHFYK
jgi:hypothetical protein